MSDNLNKMIAELGEGFGINDTNSGSNIFAYTWDNHGIINDMTEEGKIVWNRV